MELFSERFYQDREILNVHLQKYNTKCSKIYSPKESAHMQYLCKIVLKYLEESTKWEKNKTEYDDCILLNYWLYDKLTKYFVHDKSYINFAYGSIETIWSNLVTDIKERSYYNKCKPLFREILIHDNWEKGKELYDYYVDFKTIFDIAKNFPERCREYYKKIEDKTSLYEYFQENCSPEKDNCPYFYGKCKDYNPALVLSDLPCHNKIVAERIPSAKNPAAEHSSDKELGFASRATGTDVKQENSGIGTKVGHSVLAVTPVLLTASVIYK
ncbi:PIR Superfamily Protein, partial [Plasmodium ovale curtisi]